MKQTWRIRGGSNGNGSQHRSAADGILRRPDHGSQRGPSGGQFRNNPGSHIEAHREQILQHILSHRVTFIQGETGCGKSTAVPQFILDDATARGRHDSVRVIVAQPRRVAAVSLARYVAHARGECLGVDVGFAVGRERASTVGRTRLMFVTSGYILNLLALDQKGGEISHIILDEVHVRSVEQDLLLLLLKLLLAGSGNNGRWASLNATKLIIMSATMEVRPLQEYFSCLQKTEESDQTLDPIIIKGRRFPVEIIHIDEIPGYLPGLPKTVADLATRFLEISGTGGRALDGTNLPHFAIDLVTGLVMHVGRAGDFVLVFVANFSDIFEVKQGFERVVKCRDPKHVPLDVMFLHSMLSSEDQKIAIEPPRPGTLKVIIATNIAESSLTIPNVRVVFDLGHQLEVGYSNNSGGTMSRVWCSKASASQRAGRAGRLIPGVVIRLYTRETFQNLPEYEKPDIALQKLGSTILRVKSLFQCQFPKFSVVELLQQLLDAPRPENLSVSMKELQTLGAIASTSSSESCELTLLGRLATELSLDIDLARFVLMGVVMGCAVDCVIMVAGISLPNDIFHQPLLFNRESDRDPMFLQERRIANLRVRMQFQREYASDLLMYCEVYSEWLNINPRWTSSQEWIRRNEFKNSNFNHFLLMVRDYAQKTIVFVTREFGYSMQDEVSNLRTLAAVDLTGPVKYGRNGSTIPRFCNNLAIVQMAIAGAFARNWLIGFPAKHMQGVAETRDLEASSLSAHLSFKLSNVPPNLAGPDIGKLEMALKVLGPIHKVVPFSERAVMVQCELQQENMTSLTPPPVILDLPSSGRLANYMAKSFFPQGKLVINKREGPSTAHVEELYLGMPSGPRTIKWKVRMGNEVRRVRFSRLNMLSSAVEVRKDIPFHIGIAVNLHNTADGASDIHASNVTVLPQEKFFSVLVLLMFRPSGPEGELQVRILSNSDQIYVIKYQGVTLELAPRFISMTTLKYIDRVRAKIQRFMGGAGVRNCNLARDLMDLLEHLRRTEHGTPVLAPEIGSWLTYPSLLPVRELDAKLEESNDQLKLASHKQPQGSPRLYKETRSCPVLLQSRSDKYRNSYEANYRESAHGNASKLSDVQLLEQAFEAAELEVDRRQLVEWIGGNKANNGICFELLQRLARNPAHMEHTKVVLQYVYSRRNEMVNQKQTKELEGLYHSICNPDSTPSSASGRKAPKRVEVQKHKSDVQCQGLRSPTAPEMNDDSIITRHVAVQRPQNESIISALEYHHFAAKVTVGSFASSRPGLVTVSGKSRDVEFALQGIATIIENIQRSPSWKLDDTYIDSLVTMDENVHCVYAHGPQRHSSSVTADESLEFMLVQDSQSNIAHGNRSACGASSIFHSRMKENFDKVLEGLGPGKNVQIQARLGHVIFGCSGVFKKLLPFLDGQAKPLGELKRYLDRHQINKRRFDDTIPEKEFHHLRACLHLCHPSRVERHKNYIIVVSNPTATDKRDRDGKFKITDALDAPGRFHIQGMERKTRLAVADIVRLHAGAIQVDVRLSMQENEEYHEISEEAREFVRNIRKKGSQLEFPAEPYIVRLQRHKDSGSSQGIFIPARDPSGQITGGQIKVDDNWTGKRKYVWLSSNKLFQGGKGPQIEGELPLFCCVPRERDTSIIGLCEGGLKAHVLAALSGLPVIGGSGADFNRSKNLFQDYLLMMDVEQIIFFPDAGSQCNDQVTSCYFQTFRLLRDWRYNVLVAWWGQVNKTEHDDIDDYLMKNTCATELPLLSTFQFWQCLSPDVQDSLQSKFPEYKAPQVSDVMVGIAQDNFTDDDHIQIMKMSENLGSCDYYHIRIPKEVMKNMPRAPDDYVTPQSVQTFTIEVLMVRTDDPVGVEAAIDWLLPQRDARMVLGLDCEHGFNGDLNLIQVSTHQRCVLIRLTSKSLPHTSRLATVLRDKKVVKSGAEVHNDALAIYDTLGLMVNGLKNVSPAYKIMNRTPGMLEIFRDLYGWEWTKKKTITRSDWSCTTLTLEQIKYAALDAWASRMIVLEGRAALDQSVVSMENLHEELLKLFARAITNYGMLQRTEKTVFETSGNISETSGSTLRLLQHNFRSRVTNIGSRVELRFNDGQEPVQFEASTRTGKSVVLTPLSSTESTKTNPTSSKTSVLPIDINSISNVIVDNSRSHNPQLRRLRDLFYDLLCNPEKCPALLSQALQHGKENTSQKRGHERPCIVNKGVAASTSQSLNHGKTTTRTNPGRPTWPRAAAQLQPKHLQKVLASLNDSQGEALQKILTSRLSATIGPPGTGKTRLITAVAKAWLRESSDREVLLCTAYQNVAARNLAEALTEHRVPGVLLLVSEDYFVDWHETFYEKLGKSVVVTKTKCEIPGALEDWRTRNKRSSVPILVCTLGLVGSPAFMTCLMGGKVTAMVIDECSQAAEGSCIYPLTCLPDLSLLTVLGDPYQLPPFSGSGSRHIKVPSIFDLVSNGCEVKLLREQYRMPPMICKFISSEIYQNELQTSSNRWKEGDWQHPLLWVDVQGVSSKDPGHTSIYNTAEAQTILQVCQKLTKSYTKKGVVVLTLYEEQNRRISQLLDTENLQERVSVHNVDSFQGQQNDIVLLSLVAGKHFSAFAADRHRACVMLTRVKRFLCVCGNYEAVRWNHQALLWKSLAEFCGAHGLVVALQDVEPLLVANLLAATACC